MDTPSPSARMLAEAAQWLARRDRGFNAAEQDAYLQWLRSDPAHAAAIARHEATLQLMMTVAEWRPEHSTEPNPDLFAPTRRLPWRRLPWILAAAAVVAVGTFVGTHWAGNDHAEVAQHRSYLRVNERQALPDGSGVELKDGSRIALAYTSAERRVRLTGEAYFTVVKDSTRPFLVEAGGVTVRAVGTAFNVRLDPDSLDVLVTEGVVEVDTPQLPPRVPNDQTSPSIASDERPRIAAKERMTINLTSPAPVRAIAVSAESIREALSWQEPRLQFFETPLAVALAEFNRHNDVKMILAEPALGAFAIGGTFRLRNVEGFVTLLELTLDLHATRRSANEIVLARAP